jgi:hypothetical protein
MPVAKKKQIFSDSIHLKIRIVLHYPAIQGHDVFHTSQGASRVTRLAAMHHSEDVAPHLNGQVL